MCDDATYVIEYQHNMISFQRFYA